VPDSDSIDRLIQVYDSKFGLDARTQHSAIAVELLGGRQNTASSARVELEAAIAGAGTSIKAAELLTACGQAADMARAALEYQIRINEVILGLPAR